MSVKLKLSASSVLFCFLVSSIGYLPPNIYSTKNMALSPSPIILASPQNADLLYPEATNLYEARETLNRMIEDYRFTAKADILLRRVNSVIGASKNGDIVSTNGLLDEVNYFIKSANTYLSNPNVWSTLNNPRELEGHHVIVATAENAITGMEVLRDENGKLTEYGERIAFYHGGLGVLMRDLVCADSDLGYTSELEVSDDKTTISFWGLCYGETVETPTIDFNGFQRYGFSKNVDVKRGEPAVKELLRYPNTHPLKGEVVVITIPMPNQESIKANVRIVRFGRMKQYLISPIGKDADQLKRLYDDEPASETRLRHQYIMGVGIIEVMKKLNIPAEKLLPHLNEGFCTFIQIGLIRYFRETKGFENFTIEDITRIIGAMSSTTIHTLVPAGITPFDRNLYFKYVYAYLVSPFEGRKGMSETDFDSVKSFISNVSNSHGNSSINPATVSVMWSNSCNGVSQLNTDVCNRDYGTKKFVSIQNGVDVLYWQKEQLTEIFEESPYETILDPQNEGHRTMFSQINEGRQLTSSSGESVLTDKDMWVEMQQDTEDMLEYIRGILGQRWKIQLAKIEGDIQSKTKAFPHGVYVPEEIRQEIGRLIEAKRRLETYLDALKKGEVLPSDRTPVGWARRIVDYKRMLLIMLGRYNEGFEDELRKVIAGSNSTLSIYGVDSLIEKMLSKDLYKGEYGALTKFVSLITDKNFMFIFGGKAHPKDLWGQYCLAFVNRLLMHPKLKDLELWKYVTHVCEYDERVSRLMIKGCRFWIASSRSQKEASGTSGIKAMLNGTPCISTRDGFYILIKDGISGLLYGDKEPPSNDKNDKEGQTDYYASEAGGLYSQLEVAYQMLQPTTNIDGIGIPSEYLAMSRAAIYSALTELSGTGMAEGYVRLYASAAGKSKEVFEAVSKKFAEQDKSTPSFVFKSKHNIFSDKIEAAVGTSSNEVVLSVDFNFSHELSPAQIEEILDNNDVYFWFGPDSIDNLGQTWGSYKARRVDTTTSFRGVGKENVTNTCYFVTSVTLPNGPYRVTCYIKPKNVEYGAVGWERNVLWRNQISSLYGDVHFVVNGPRHNHEAGVNASV